jgi:hypothetical protein
MGPDIGLDLSEGPPAANENHPPMLADHSWPVLEPDISEKTALALLRCGRSFAEAAESSAVGLDRIVALWRNLQRPGES